MTETPTRPTPAPGVEYKALPGAEQAFAAATVGDEGTFRAIVAVTGVIDEVGDYIVPGAFEKSLSKLTPKGVASHEWKTAISRAEEPIVELYPGDPRLPTVTRDGDPWPADAGGVLVVGRYNLEKEAGRDAYADAKFYQGEHSYSIGYHVPEGKSRTMGGIRYIDELECYEWSDVLHGANRYSQLQQVKTLTQRIREESPEIKVRTVRNSEYWGLPYGTPIRPGMKPKGKLARAMADAGEAVDPDAGTSDKPTVPDAPGAGVSAPDDLMAAVRKPRASLDDVVGYNDEQLEAAATVLDGDGKPSSTRKAATLRQMIAARAPRKGRSHGADSLAGGDDARIGSRNPVLADERRRRENAAAYAAGKGSADPHADLPEDDSDIHQGMVAGTTPINEGVDELRRRSEIRQRRRDVIAGRVSADRLEPYERPFHRDTKDEPDPADDLAEVPTRGPQPINVTGGEGGTLADLDREQPLPDIPQRGRSRNTEPAQMNGTSERAVTKADRRTLGQAIVAARDGDEENAQRLLREALEMGAPGADGPELAAAIRANPGGTIPGPLQGAAAKLADSLDGNGGRDTPDAPDAPDAPGSGRDAVPADADADTIADALSGVWNDYHVDADQVGNSDRNHYADRMRDVLSQQGLDDYAVSDAVDEMLYEDYPNEVADAASRIAQNIVGQRGMTGRDADGNPTFGPSGPSVGAPDATVDERRTITGRERGGQPDVPDDDRRARAREVIARMRGEDGADPAEVDAADAAPDDLADPDAPDPDAPPDEPAPDAGPDEVISTDEQDAVDAAADAAAGIVEDDDGEVTISADDAERQDRVEELLDRQMAGRLNLAEQSNAELTTTRSDLVGELNLQVALSRRDKRQQDRSQVYEGGSDGGEGATPNAPDAAADAPAGATDADGGAPAAPQPMRRAKREGRPGLAGAAEDMADALESMDADRIERTRMRLEQSLNRSRNGGEDHDALRALVDAAAPGGDGAVAEDVRQRATAIRNAAKEKRNTAARSRRTAKRLERERIRSLIGEVDTEMRGRGMNPDDSGGPLADDPDAPATPDAPEAPPEPEAPASAPPAGPTQAREVRTGEYGPVAQMPDSPDRGEANGPGYRVDQQREPDGSWTTAVTQPDGSRTVIYTETRAEGRREARNMLSGAIVETRDGPEPAVAPDDLPEAPGKAEVVAERRDRIAAAAQRPGTNPTTGEVDATSAPAMADTPTMTPRAGEDVSATRARWAEQIATAEGPTGRVLPDAFDWSTAMQSPGGGLIALKLTDERGGQYRVYHAETGAKLDLDDLSQSEARSVMDVLERGIGPGGQPIDWSGDTAAVRASMAAAGFDGPDARMDLARFAKASAVASAVDAGRADSPFVSRAAGARGPASGKRFPNTVAAEHIDDMRAALKLLLNDGKKRPTQAGGLVSEKRSKEEIADDKATMSVSRAATNVERLGAPDRAVAMLEQRADQLDAAYGPDAAGGHGSLILRAHARSIRDRYNPEPAGPDAIAQADIGERIGLVDGDGRVRVYRVTENIGDVNGSGRRQIMAVEEGGDGSQTRFSMNKAGNISTFGPRGVMATRDEAVLDPDEAMPQTAERMAMIAAARPDNPVMDEAVDAARQALDARADAGKRQAPAKPTRKRRAAAKPGTSTTSSPQRPPSARVAERQGARERNYVGTMPALAETANGTGYASVDDALGPYRRSDNPDVVARFSGDAWNGAKMSDSGWFVIRRDGTVYHAVTGKTAGPVAVNQDVGKRFADMLERVGDPDTGQPLDWHGDPTTAIRALNGMNDNEDGGHPLIRIMRQATVDDVAAKGPRATKAGIEAMPNGATAQVQGYGRPGVGVASNNPDLKGVAARKLSRNTFSTMSRDDFDEGASGDADWKRAQALNKTLEWGTKLGAIRPYDTIVGLRQEADNAGDADIGIMGGQRRKIADLLNDAADTLERANDPEQQTNVEKWLNNYGVAKLKVSAPGTVTVDRGSANPGSGNGKLGAQVESALRRNNVELRNVRQSSGQQSADQLEITGVTIPGVNDNGAPLRIGGPMTGSGVVPGSTVKLDRETGNITASFRASDPDNLGHDVIVKINIPGDGWDMRRQDDPAPGDGGVNAPTPVERDIAKAERDAAPRSGPRKPSVRIVDQGGTFALLVDRHDGRGERLQGTSPTGSQAGYPEARADGRERGIAKMREWAKTYTDEDLDVEQAPGVRPQPTREQIEKTSKSQRTVRSATESKDPRIAATGRAAQIMADGGTDEEAAESVLTGPNASGYADPADAATAFDGFAAAARKRNAGPVHHEDDRPLGERLEKVASLIRAQSGGQGDGDAGAGQQGDGGNDPPATDAGRKEVLRLGAAHANEIGPARDRAVRAKLEAYDDDTLAGMVGAYAERRQGSTRADGSPSAPSSNEAMAREILASRQGGGARGRDVAPDGADPGGGADDRNTVSVTDMTPQTGAIDDQGNATPQALYAAMSVQPRALRDADGLEPAGNVEPGTIVMGPGQTRMRGMVVVGRDGNRVRVEFSSPTSAARQGSFNPGAEHPGSVRKTLKPSEVYAVPGGQPDVAAAKRPANLPAPPSGTPSGRGRGQLPDVAPEGSTTSADLNVGDRVVLGKLAGKSPKAQARVWTVDRASAPKTPGGPGSRKKESRDILFRTDDGDVIRLDIPTDRPLERADEAGGGGGRD